VSPSASFETPRTPVVAQICAAKPELATREIPHRVRERDSDGGKSALYDLVVEMRSPP
jgi:hypothetical protein